MNIIEFSIACKLISAKLKGVLEVPKILPPTLIASLQHIGTPIRTPTGAMSPTESYKQFLTQQPAVPVPMIQPQAQTQVQPQPQMVQTFPQQDMIYQQTIAPVIPQMYAPSVIPPQPVKVPLLEQLSGGSLLLDNLTQVQPAAVPISSLPAAPTPTPPQSGHASRSMSFSEKAPSIPESP